MNIYFYLGLVLILIVFAAYVALVRYCNKSHQKENFSATCDEQEIRCNALIKRFGDDNKSKLRLKLEKMLPPNAMKYSKKGLEWFEMQTLNISHDAYCIQYIEKFNDLSAQFWKNLEKQRIDIAHDEIFQRLLISIRTLDRFDAYDTNFGYFLCSYGSRYKLLPQFLEILNKDDRFKNSKKMYECGRNYRKRMGKPLRA